MSNSNLSFYFLTESKRSLTTYNLIYYSKLISNLFDEINIEFIPLSFSFDESVSLPKPAYNKIAFMLNPKTDKLINYGTNWLESFDNKMDNIDDVIRAEFDDFVYVNSPESIKLLRDKVRMSNHIIKNTNLPHPQFYEPDIDNLMLLLSDGKKLCIKPRAGTEGSGVTRLVYSRDEDIFYVRSMYKKDSITCDSMDLISSKKITQLRLNRGVVKQFLDKLINYGVIVQDWIEPVRVPFRGELKIVDFRNIVVYPEYVGGVTSELFRVSMNDLVTNMSVGGLRTSYVEVSDELKKYLDDGRKLSVEAAKAFNGLNVSGVDLIRGEKGWELIELNAMPGIGTVYFGANRFPQIFFGAMKDLGFTLSDKQEEWLSMTFSNAIQPSIDNFLL